MSQLRAPAPRSDRREGGRHGRSGARPAPAGTSPAGPAPAAPAELRIRSQLLRTSVLPAVAVALGGAAALLFVLRSTGAAPTPALWAALTGAAALTVASVTAAALGADRAARSVLDRLAALRREAARDRAELRAVVEQLRAGEEPPPRPALPEAAGDEFDRLGADLAHTHEVAVAAVVQASRFSGSAGDEQKVEVFVNLARRLQSLVHREIQILDELENETEDPELLKGLFHVDHLATRIRRHAENLAVLGGAVSRRQWSNPVSTTEVLRSAIAEVEQYPRVKLVPPIDGTLRGHAVADVIHLLAELVENATVFSAPHTSVLLRAQYVTAGLAIEVEDRGLGMPAAEQDKMNALLADPDQVNVAHLLQDGRIGLFVVAALARRHGITVRLQANIYGGVQAVLVLPQGLLGTDPEGRAPHERPHELPPAHPREPAPEQRLPEAPETPEAPVIPANPEIPAAPEAPAILTAPVPPAAPAAPAPLPQRHPTPPSAEGPAPQPVPLPEPEPYAYPRTPAHGTDLTDFGGFAPQVPPALPAQPADRPLLPRRRAQEHLVPQLREEPQQRQSEDLALHDPGLMAAFQRGIGLAESQPTPQEPLRHGDAYKE
ncbi:signal transduction histidine kinase [Streptomyces filamentosus]